jgi:predicted nucleotidyltransferase
MGPVSRTIEQEMIPSPGNNLAEIVRREIIRLNTIVPGCKWYLFGSVATAKRSVSDIDVLVVCDTHELCAKVREGLSAACAESPIHLLLMTQSEEEELNFISSQRAIEIRL